MVIEGLQARDTDTVTYFLNRLEVGIKGVYDDAFAELRSPD